MAAFEKIRDCDEEEQKNEILSHLVTTCHPNWYKKTYSSKVITNVPIPDVPPPLHELPSTVVTTDEQVWMNRFQEVIKYLTPEFVEEALDVMERKALDEESEGDVNEPNSDATSGDDTNSDDNTSSSDTTVSNRLYYESMNESANVTTQIRNPPKRKNQSGHKFRGRQNAKK